MDTQYHKACWTKHVFHVLRGDTNQAPKTKKSPTQGSTFVENHRYTDQRWSIPLNPRHREHICQHATFGWNRDPRKSFTCLHQATVERQNPFWITTRNISPTEKHAKSCTVQRPVMQTFSRLLSQLQMTLKAWKTSTNQPDSFANKLSSSPRQWRRPVP